jgi:hypothetical protein
LEDPEDASGVKGFLVATSCAGLSVVVVTDPAVPLEAVVGTVAPTFPVTVVVAEPPTTGGTLFRIGRFFGN